jgi:hypothetical protein
MRARQGHQRGQRRRHRRAHAPLVQAFRQRQRDPPRAGACQIEGDGGGRRRRRAPDHQGSKPPSSPGSRSISSTPPTRSRTPGPIPSRMPIAPPAKLNTLPAQADADAVSAGGTMAGLGSRSAPHSTSSTGRFDYSGTRRTEAPAALAPHRGRAPLTTARAFATHMPERGYGEKVSRELPKLKLRVRFPLPAPLLRRFLRRHLVPQAQALGIERRLGQSPCRVRPSQDRHMHRLAGRDAIPP